MKKNPPAVAVIGFGEVGSSFASALVGAGCRVTVCVRAGPSKTKALSVSGITVTEDVAGSVSNADLVLSAVTGESAAVVAAAAADVIRPGAFFADLTASDPDDIRRSAKRFADGGRHFVDVAIMGAISIYGNNSPMLASGECAGQVAGLMNRLGFRMRVLPGSAVGDATSLKLVRSVLTKGMEAVIIESFLAAEALGLTKQLFDTMEDLDASSMSRIIEMFLRTHRSAAARRLHEMEQAQEHLSHLELPQFVLPAVLSRLRRTVSISPNDPASGSGEDAVANLKVLLAAERGAPPSDFEAGLQHAISAMP